MLIKDRTIDTVQNCDNFILIVGWNPTRGVDVCLRLLCVSVILCDGSVHPHKESCRFLAYVPYLAEKGGKQKKKEHYEITLLCSLQIPESQNSGHLCVCTCVHQALLGNGTLVFSLCILYMVTVSVIQDVVVVWTGLI
jgi:hypothetical protein